MGKGRAMGEGCEHAWGPRQPSAGAVPFSRPPVLTCPKGSRWLLVSLSFWKETSCLIQWAPVAGESGCTYSRPGMAGSAFPVTDLRGDTGTELWAGWGNAPVGSCTPSIPSGGVPSRGFLHPFHPLRRGPSRGVLLPHPPPNPRGVPTHSGVRVRGGSAVPDGHAVFGEKKRLQTPFGELMELFGTSPVGDGSPCFPV